MRRYVHGLIGSVLALAACSEPADEQAFEPLRVDRSPMVAGGDMAAIEDRGRLRLLVPSSHARPDAGGDPEAPLTAQIRHVARFARSLDLEPVLVPVEHHEDLLPDLRRGRGDVIVANLALADVYRDRAAFTVPVDRARRVLVARADDPIKDVAGVGGRTLTVPFDSHYWTTALDLQDRYPRVSVDSLPALGLERALELLADGQVDLTLVDSNRLEAALPDHDAVRAVQAVSDDTGIAFAVRPEAIELRDMLNRFISQRALADRRPAARTTGLEGIREARTLRLATRNSAANYFVWRGQVLGFEYELAERFAERLGVRLDVIVAEPGDSLTAMLRDGRADLAGAFLTAADDAEGIAWSRFYHRTQRVIVGAPRTPPVESLAELDGRRFHVPADSREARALRALADEHDLDLRITLVDADVDTETLLGRVAAGDYRHTLVDGHIARNAMIWIDGLRTLLELGDEVTHHWAVRAENEELLAAVDGYLAETHRSAFYNTLYAKYFRDRERVRGYSMQRVDLGDGRRLSPYDDIVREHAQRHGFDWRLVLAQIYQESGFDPEARSWMGARGLMQIMPRTAEQMGVTENLTDPERNIAAGIRYLDWLRDRFPEDLPVLDRMWFVLASYNAGVGHVRDARKLAERLGHDPDRWFGNVEIAMEKLSHAEYFREARFGYVRGEEPVGYVRAIRERYQAYILWTDDCWPVCSDSPHPEPRMPIAPGNILQAQY